MKHVHDWRPLTSWPGRRRCATCRVLGWVATPETKRVTAYRCTRAGCTNEAVVNNRRSGQLCRLHAPNLPAQ